MGKKLAVMAALLALLACALTSAALAAQFTSKIGIRFVEVTIPEAQTPLSDGQEETGMTESDEDGSGDSYEAALRAWFPKAQRQCE